MEENAPKAEVAEVVTEMPAQAVCPDPACQTCFMVSVSLQAFESAVGLLTEELKKEKKSLAKINLVAGVAVDLGSAFTRLMNSTNVDGFAVPDAKGRFVRAATLMNQNHEEIRYLQMLAGIIKVGN